MGRFFSLKKIVIMLTMLDLAILGRVFYLNISFGVPDKITIIKDEETVYDFGVPVKMCFNEDSSAAINIEQDAFDNSMEIEGVKAGDYDVSFKLLGLFTLKDVDVSVIEPVEIYPVGKCIGIYVETDGIMVLGCGDVECSDGTAVSPGKNILKAGDYILKINSTSVDGIADFTSLVNESDKDKIVLTIRRNGEVFDVAVNRVKAEDGSYKVGLWIRENLQGIGTITYMKENGSFGALGHSINDSNSGNIMEIKEGQIYNPTIKDIIKGKQKSPGEIYGTINYDYKNYYGNIYDNTSEGIYGSVVSDKIEDVLLECSLTGIKLKNEINKGDATIICSLDGERKEYDISIEEIDYNSENNKNMIIRITDEELLGITNGIVQGMSGSPIIQDGKVVGAVTHVFVNDPSKGYGIFIESMLDNGN